MVNPVNTRAQQVGGGPDHAITKPSTKEQEDTLLIMRPHSGPAAAEENSRSHIHECQSAPVRQPKPITFPDMDRILQRHGIFRNPNGQFSIPHQPAQEQDMYQLGQVTDSSSSRSESRPQHGYLSFRPPLIHGDPDGPSNLQLLGYAGLEDAPFTGKLISTPKLHGVYRQYYEYDKTTCPAGILYFDPADRQSGEAWLYVRNEGVVEWKRDFLAERGGMRYFVYIKEDKDGWQWKQVLGDVVNARAEVNLFVKDNLNAGELWSESQSDMHWAILPSLPHRPQASFPIYVSSNLHRFH